MIDTNYVTKVIEVFRSSICYADEHNAYICIPLFKGLQRNAQQVLGIRNLCKMYAVNLNMIAVFYYIRYLGITDFEGLYS